MAKSRRLTASRASATTADAAPLPSRSGQASLQNRVAYRFSILANLSSAALAAMYGQRFSLTTADWKTLAIVGHYEPVWPGSIAERTSMVPESVSRALDRLYGKGLIDRENDEQDRRRVVVTLSRKGRKAFSEIEKVRLAMEEDLLGALSAGERESLFSILDKLDKCAHEKLAGGEGWRKYAKQA